MEIPNFPQQFFIRLTPETRCSAGFAYIADCGQFGQDANMLKYRLNARSRSADPGAIVYWSRGRLADISVTFASGRR